MKKLLLFLFFFFTGVSVLAYNSPINISDDINVLYYDSDYIKIKIDDKLKSNNTTFYYQFIKASEDDILNFENKNNYAYEKLASCLERSSQDECINNYNVEKDDILSTAPVFSDNWNKVSNDNSSIYSVPKIYDNYFLWVKVVSPDGNDLYSLFYESATLNNDVLVNGVQTSVGTVSDYSDVIAIASMLLSAGGMISFILSIMYIVKYSNFKFKLNY